MTRLMTLSVFSMFLGLVALTGCAGNNTLTEETRTQKLSVAAAEPINAPDIDWRMRESYGVTDTATSAGR